MVYHPQLIIRASITLLVGLRLTEHTPCVSWSLIFWRSTWTASKFIPLSLLWLLLPSTSVPSSLRRRLLSLLLLRQVSSLILTHCLGLSLIAPWQMQCRSSFCWDYTFRLRRHSFRPYCFINTFTCSAHFVPGYHPKLGKATHTCALRFSFDISIHSLLQPITIILHLQPHQTLRFRFGRKSFKFDRHIY